jgi:hypothetical protein
VVSGQPDAGGVSPATRDNQSKLWDHPDGPSVEARHRSRLYNASTLLTLTSGVLICYVALYLVNVAWALFILDPHVMGSYLQTRLGYADLFVLAWLVASAATFGGALGTGLESDEAIRTAAYSKREEERRERLARQRRAAERWPGAGGWGLGATLPGRSATWCSSDQVAARCMVRRRLATVHRLLEDVRGVPWAIRLLGPGE